MQKELYERIGGSLAVAKIVDRFYQRIMADPELAPFFKNSPVDKIVAMQNQFFAVALGGTAEYSGRSLREAHQGRGIRREHVSAFTEHLLATLEESGIKNPDANQVVSRIATYTDEVLGEATVDG